MAITVFYKSCSSSFNDVQCIINVNKLQIGTNKPMFVHFLLEKPLSPS